MITNSKHQSLRIFLILILFPISINAQEEGQSLKQYLFLAFTNGTIKFIKGKPRSLMLNYNTVTGRMVFEQKGQYFDLTGQESIDTIYLQNRKFIPYENFYLEVIFQDRISLSIQHVSHLQAPGKPAGYGGTSELAASNYITSIELSSGFYNLKLPEKYVVIYSPVYWVYDGNKWQKFLSARQFVKVFPGNENEINQFIKKYKIKFDRANDLIRLAEYCNSIIGKEDNDNNNKL